MSEGKVRSTPDGACPKRQKTSSSPAIVAGLAATTIQGAAVPSSPTPGSSASGKAYALAKAKISELSAHLDQLAVDFDEDVRSRDSELSEVRRANIALQSDVNELAERNRVLEGDAASVKKRDEELSGKLTKASMRHVKDREEIALLKRQLRDAEDLTDAKIEEAVVEAKDEAARDFTRRARDVARLLEKIEGTAKNNMLDLAEVDANLEFIEHLRRPDGPTLDAAERDLVERKIPIYNARDVFGELVSGVRQALGISEDDEDDEA